jgi:hypothetical protein
MENGEVCEEFDVDDHYVGHASQRLPPSFRIAVDCHEGYMLILRPGDETYAKPVCMGCKNFVRTKFYNLQP